MIKKQLKAYLKSFNYFSDNDIEIGLEYFNLKKIKKNDYLIESGDYCNWIAFVCNGILRNFYLSSKSEEVTYCITFPNNFMSAFSSFISGTKTFENIHALTDSEILIIKKQDYNKLISSNKSWLNFARLITEQSYIQMESRLLSFQMEPAENRYVSLIKNHPEYIKEIPLKYLASFLGISQRHLSRLRKEIQ